MLPSLLLLLHVLFLLLFFLTQITTATQATPAQIQQRLPSLLPNLSQLLLPSLLRPFLLPSWRRDLRL
jgi:hypothetical protein